MRIKNNDYWMRSKINKLKNQNKITGILNKNEISDQLRNRDIIIDPILDPELQLDNASVDLRLDHFFAEFQTTKKPCIDPAHIEEEYDNFLNFVELECFSECYYLQPKKFVLAQTLEYICLPNYIVGELDGRSSMARMGLMVHATAGLVDPGFKGHLVFELLNAGDMPLKLYPLMRIAKISFYKTRPTPAYSGQYNFQIKIRAPINDPDILLLVKLSEAKKKLL